MKKTVVISVNELDGFLPVRVEGSRLYDLLDEIREAAWSNRDNQIVITVETQ